MCIRVRHDSNVNEKPAVEEFFQTVAAKTEEINEGMEKKEWKAKNHPHPVSSYQTSPILPKYVEIPGNTLLNY
jgi:hypothetical protein